MTLKGTENSVEERFVGKEKENVFKHSRVRRMCYCIQAAMIADYCICLCRVVLVYGSKYSS